MWLVELLTGIAWPILIGTIVWWLRPAISTFLQSFEGTDRKVSVAVAGVTATIEAKVQQQKRTGENPASEKLDPQPVLLPPTNRALSIIEERLHEEIKPVETDQREDLLIRALAASRLEGSHEFVYNRIFGSQIEGLKRLSDSYKVSVEDATAFFQKFANAHPNVHKYGFEVWLSFLLTNGLVVRQGDFLELGELGHDFLRYIAEKRLTELKAF